MADGDPSTSQAPQSAPFGSWLRAGDEIDLPAEDAALVQMVVGALRHPSLQDDMRHRLREVFSRRGLLGFKAFLMSAPLEGVDLERDRRIDDSRDIDW